MRAADERSAAIAKFLLDMKMYTQDETARSRGGTAQGRRAH